MLLSLHNIRKFYSNAKGFQREVLNNLMLSVEEGDQIAIVGPSGSGKSTLLNILGTMDTPNAGEMRFKGKNINALNQQEKLNYRNQEIGFIFQQHHLLPQCTLLENVLLPTLVKNHDKSADSNYALKLLTMLNIEHLKDQKPNEVSVGECQRAAIARALINKPALILADEPSGSLDEENTRILGDLLLELSQKEGLTLIVVTHSLEFAKRMDKVYMLSKGSLELLNQ
jgi:lipoprotein-releasing system ATP-binding protein